MVLYHRCDLLGDVHGYENLTKPYKAMQFLNLTLPGNILCRDPEDQGDQQRPKRQVRPMQTSRDCWTPRWTTGDQGRPDH